jgi:hypothetical protein
MAEPIGRTQLLAIAHLASPVFAGERLRGSAMPNQ